MSDQKIDLPTIEKIIPGDPAFDGFSFINFDCTMQDIEQPAPSVSFGGLRFEFGQFDRASYERRPR